MQNLTKEQIVEIYQQIDDAIRNRVPGMLSDGSLDVQLSGVTLSYLQTMMMMASF